MAELHHPNSARSSAESATVDHETSDVNIRAVFAFGVGLAALTMIVALAVWLLFQYFAAREAAGRVAEYPLAVQDSRVPPEPRLQTNPRQDLTDLRAKEDEWLTSYGWVDKNAGVVRIPIERAMRLVVERGLPARRIGERSAEPSRSNDALEREASAERVPR